MRPFRLGTPWAIITGFLTVGMLTVLFGHVRVGGWVISLGLLAGAFMRAALPERFVTDISVRSRTTDMVAYAGLAAVVLVGVSALKL